MGIDYGMGQTNVDVSNGIRFGVISMHEVTQAWCDDSEPQYGQPELSDCDCQECGHNDGISHSWGDSLICEECGEEFEVEFPDCCEPIAHTIANEEYSATQSNDDVDIFITKSPYYTNCGFCSPCAPGAGYLLTRSDDCRAYCFGHDWFESGCAPYPVFRVTDDTLVLPDNVDDYKTYFEDIELGEQFEEFVNGYLLGLAFTAQKQKTESSEPESMFGEPGCDIADCVDVESDIWDKLPIEHQKTIIADCASFFAEAYTLIATDLARAGSDFHLTRNGHGAGFWDGDWDNGDKLTKLAKPYGSFELVVYGKHVDDFEDEFEGSDASLEISFFEYGLLWSKEIDEDNAIKFIYPDAQSYVDEKPTRYHWAWIASDCDVKSEFNWVDWPGFLSSIGADFEEWNESPLGQKIFDLVGHYGTENIFGSDYHNGNIIYCDDTLGFDVIN